MFQVLSWIVESLIIQAHPNGFCRSEVADPRPEGFDEWNLRGKLLIVFIRFGTAGLDQSNVHGCPAPLLVTARAFESTSRTLVIARAADSASAF